MKVYVHTSYTWLDRAGIFVVAPIWNSPNIYQQLSNKTNHGIPIQRKEIKTQMSERRQTPKPVYSFLFFLYKILGNTNKCERKQVVVSEQGVDRLNKGNEESFGVMNMLIILIL